MRFERGAIIFLASSVPYSWPLCVSVWFAHHHRSVQGEIVRGFPNLLPLLRALPSAPIDVAFRRCLRFHRIVCRFLFTLRSGAWVHPPHHHRASDHCRTSWSERRGCACPSCDERTTAIFRSESSTGVLVDGGCGLGERRRRI